MKQRRTITRAEAGAAILHEIETILAREYPIFDKLHADSRKKYIKRILGDVLDELKKEAARKNFDPELTGWIKGLSATEILERAELLRQWSDQLFAAYTNKKLNNHDN